MKPAAFDYERPEDLDAALALIADESRRVKVIAGGQSLGPMLNLRLARPDAIADLASIEQLRAYEVNDDSLLLGACTTHADIEDGRAPDPSQGAMRAVAAGIAYRAVRNRGTIGGSVVHADPSADWISALAALDVACVVESRQGRRAISADDFVLGPFETRLRPDEILVALRIPKLSAGSRWGFFKTCRKTGEFASAIGVVVQDRARSVCRVVLGATGGPPIVIREAGRIFKGAADSLDPDRMDMGMLDDLLRSSGVQDVIDRRLRIQVLRRAVRQAVAT